MTYVPAVAVTVAPPSIVTWLRPQKRPFPSADFALASPNVVVPPWMFSVPAETVIVVSEFVPVRTNVPSPLFLKRVVFVMLS